MTKKTKPSSVRSKKKPRPRPPGGGADILITHAPWGKNISGLPRLARRLAFSAMSAVTIYAAEAKMTLVFSNDKTIRQLNRDFRKIDKPTNVLSFPALNASAIRRLRRGDMDGRVFLGDVIIAYQTVAREAKEQKKSITHHAAHMVVHGVLHLLGYDHMTDAMARRMEKLEREILREFGIADPYFIAA